MSIQSDHYIVVSKGLIPSNTFEPKMLRGINRSVIELMEKQGFLCVEAEPRDLLFGEKFFPCLTFYNDYTRERAGLWSDFKLAIHATNKSEINRKKLRKFLATARDEYPMKFTFTVEPSQRDGKINGYLMKIESEPAILFKKQVLGIERWIEPSKYGEIIGFNDRFQRTLISSLTVLQPIEGPAPISPRGNSPVPVIEWRFVEAMPRDVETCLREANLCFEHECFVACSIMLRKALEVAVNKKFQQIGKGDELYDKEGNEQSLSKKLVKLGGFVPNVRRDVEDMKIVKWFGDKGAHDPTMSVTPEDLQTIVAPKLKPFLSKLALRA